MFAWLWPRRVEKPPGEPPRFVVPLAAISAQHGTKAVLEAQLRGQPKPKIIWYHVDKEIPHSQEFLQEHNETNGRVSLLIHEVYIDDKGLYRCVAINEHGRDETTTYVTVEDIELLEKSELRQAPQITLPLQPLIVPQGSSIDLLTKYEAFPPPTIKWYQHGKEIKPSRDFMIDTTKYNETSLHIEELFEDDRGEYEVRIFNEAGEARTTASVLITKPEEEIDSEPPKFTKLLAPQTVPEGEVAILEVQVTARPEADFTWYRHGQEIKENPDLEVQITSENNKSSLILGEVYDDDSGDYTVAAQNEGGRTACTATLLVEPAGDEEEEEDEEVEAPVFNPTLTPIRVMDGEEVRFSCKVKAKPMPKLSWFHNGRPIGQQREVRLTQTPEGRTGLYILEVFPEDAGDYTCIARNKAGEARTTANLTVESYEYRPESETGTITSTSDKQIYSGSVSEEDTLEIVKSESSDSEDSEAGSCPYFCQKLEKRIEIKDGSSVRLLAKIIGYPRAEVKWYADGQPIGVTEGRTIESYEDGTEALTLNSVVADDCGEYTCEAMNRNGVDTTTTQLVILPEHEPGSKGYRKPDWVIRMEELKTAMSAEPVKPHFVQELVNSRVKEMGTLTFTATIGGNPKPEVSWYLNQKLLHQHQFFQMRVRNDKAMLTIVNASPFVHKGEYSCKVYNSEGEAFSKARLDVIELTYEEKLTIEDERYAAVMIEHAAGIMKDKEQARRVKEREDFKLSLDKMKDEKAQRQAEIQAEMEAAKTNTWKPDKSKAFKPKEEVKEEPVYQTPTERRIAQVYTNWKSPIKVEESYPELEPEEFAPNQIPGVKCFVQVSETSVKGEEVVRDVAPQFFEDEKIIDELAKIHTMLKSNVKVSEIWHKFRAGEFKCLQQPSIQSSLVKICEFIGHQRNVSMVLAQEAKEQSARHPVGLKAFMRMLKFGSNVKTDKLFGDTIPKEMGKFSSTAEELKQVSQMLNQGVETEEIIASCEAGKLPSLKKPETQQPLINIVEKHGHSVMVAQVLVEEAYRDAKDERLMVDRAWEVVHEEEMATVEVTEVKTELPKVDAATIRTQEKLQTASASEVIIREEVQTHIQVSQQQTTSEAFEIATPTNVKMGDALRAVATYVADEQQENAMHLVEGERVYVQETSNSDWWFCKKHLTLEQGYVPAKLLAEEVSYTHYVSNKLNEKIMKLPVFDKLKKGQKAEAPSMPTKLSPKTVKDGQEVQFEVKVNGVPRPIITWFRQTAIIKPSDEFQIFYTEDNTATLVIKEVFPEDAGLFTCVAKNLAGVSSSSADMVVEGPIYHSNESRKSLSRESSVCDILEGIPPTFANRPTVKTVEEGAQIEIDVRLVAIPEADITWKKDGQILKESQRLRLVKQKDVHAYRLIIIIKGAKTDDIGTYEIVAKNREGTATNKVQLRVVAPQAPKFEEKFKDQTVEEDGTIRLVAKIHGVPCPDVNWSSTFKRGLEACTVEENSEVILECRTTKEKQCKWFKGKTELKASGNIIIEKDGLTHRLIINQAQGTDAGKYICQFDSTKTFCNLTVKTCEDFVEKLQDVEVLEKEKAVLQVQVNNDKAKVTWHKDGEEIDQHNARFKLLSEGNFRKLVLAIATLHDEGEYTCVVGDHECTCELTVRELPAEIIRKMKDQVVPKGGKASFEVELTKGDAVITWYMDEKEVRFSDHYQLSIDGKTQRLMVYNCQAEDCGTYRAVVGNSECGATLKVELQDEGDFVKKLSPQMDVNFSTDATFVVEISKDFSVEWYRQEQKISASDKYVIKKAGKKRTLIVKNVSQVDAVEYSCILANLKTSCKLNVVLLESAPSVEKQYSKQEMVVNKGQDVTLRVPFKATPKPKAFWYHKGQLLNVENSPKYLPTLEEDCASLTVKTVESHECGEYQCKLCNGCGAAYADFTVKLLDKPSKPGQPEPVKVTNDTVTLNWAVPQEDGGRKITNYMIEHRNIKEQNWVVWNQSEKVLQTTVVVTRLITNEEYMFRIAAVNEIGTSEYSMESRAVKVCEPVQPQPPNFTQRMQAIVTGLNQTVELKCVVSGTPAPKIEWFQDGKPITSDTKYENFTATYTIRSSHEHSGGMYMCKASNAAGYAECSATVIIQEAPKFEYEERLQCQRLNVGENYNVPLKVIGHPKPKISWSRNDKPLKSSEHIQIRHEESEGMTTVGIKNLTKDDSSIFTITADNSAGKSQISLNLRVVEEERAVQQEVCQVTQVKAAERPAPPMGPLAVSDVTTTTCRLTWKASSYNGGMDITSYYIERKEKTEKQFQKLAEVGPNVFTYVVQNLRENCEYFFRVFACNPLGVSDSLDASVSIKSAFEKPGPPLGPFDVSNMTESTLTLAWEEPEFNGGSPISGYLLEMRESTKKAWKKVAETKEKQIEVSGVKKGTQYCFRVFAINSVGQGPAYAPEEPITAGKKISPPGPPTSLQVIDITTKTVTLAWAPPTTTGGADLIGYIIERRMQGEKKWEKVNTVDPSVTLFCVEQLREQSEYEFRVFSENPVGMSHEAAMTEMVRLKTHATPPSPPTAPLEVRPTGPSSLMIEWGMPESDGGAPLLGYVIAIRDIKRTMWIEVGQVDANFTRLHIKELQEDHEYQVRVFARNEVGSSGPLETEDPVKVIKPTDFVPVPEDENAPSLSYSTTETLSWMREAGMDADIYSYARGRLLNRDEYFFKVWHHSDKVKAGSPKPE